MALQYDEEPDKDLATRTGALAMLIHSLGTDLAHTQQDSELTWAT